MQLIRYLILGLALLGVAQTSLAVCKRNNVAPQKISISFSNVLVLPDLKSGEVIATSNKVYLNKNYYYTGCGKKEYLEGTYEGHGAIPTNYQTYSTGVDGLGIRIAVGRNDTYDFFGHGNLNYIINPVRGDLSLDSYYIMAQLVKTKNTVNNGKLGDLSNAGGELYLEGRTSKDKPMVIVDIGGSASAIVVNPSCSLSSGSGNDMTVVLKSAKLSSFTGVGSTVGDTNFNFKLKCGGGSDDYKIKISTKFSPGKEKPIDLSKGVLGNGADTLTASNDIGIQVLSSDIPLIFENKYLLGELGTASTDYSMSMTARYYQYGDKPTAGKVVSHMVYNIDYN